MLGMSLSNAHYTWPVERKYLEMLDRSERENVGRVARPEPLPVWFGRRRCDVPPGRQAVERLTPTIGPYPMPVN